MKTLTQRAGAIGAVVAAAAVGAVAAPTSVHAEPQGFLPVDFGVGYFYGTFDENPNTTLVVGGAAEDFCADNPDDPFSGEPGLTTARLYFRDSGTVDFKVNDKDQPIHLYHHAGVSPEWIEGVCADLEADPTAVPEPFASGTANLKVRLSVISDDLIDVFNSVNGFATSDDGTEYKVRASADLIVENGAPVGNPADFVSLNLNEIRR